MKSLLLTALLAVIFTVAAAPAGVRTVCRDASGRIVGTATTGNNRTTYRDSSGRIVGSKTFR